MNQDDKPAICPDISRISFPESFTSSLASRSAFASRASAHLRMIAARWNPVSWPHSPLNAVRAAATAASTSSGVPSATRAQGAPV